MLAHAWQRDAAGMYRDYSEDMREATFAVLDSLSIAEKGLACKRCKAEVTGCQVLEHFVRGQPSDALGLKLHGRFMHALNGCDIDPSEWMGDEWDSSSADTISSQQDDTWRGDDLSDWTV